MALAVALAALSGTNSPAATGGVQEVHAEFSAFGPGELDILPGETVRWTNVSERRHTVTANDGSFDSGDLPGGDTFSHPYATAGTFPYHCRLHEGMTGEIDVSPVTLGPLPVLPVPLGDPVRFDGRTADPSVPVRIERSVAGEWRTVATAAANPDGTWAADVAPDATGDYRAAVDAGASRARHLIVADRKVLVRPVRGGIAVTVTPPLPYGHIVLEELLRERFGWWPAVRTRLDYVSEARFAVAAPARVRVALLDRDGWTSLATSRTLLLRRG